MDNNTLSLFPELEPYSLTSYSTGVFPSQKIAELIEARSIFADTEIGRDQVQPASLDLRLGPVAYRVHASFLPNQASTVIKKIEEMKAYKIDLSTSAILEKGCVYIVPLMEELSLPPYIFGKANPKSTTGRLDVFTRLITDHGIEFERVPVGYKGKLYLEIVPRTFSILVRMGTRLNQLRLVRGGPLPSDAQLNELHREETLVYSEDDVPSRPRILNGLWLSVNLQGGNNSRIVGYKAKKHAPLIDLDKVNHYKPLEFWEPIIKPNTKQIVLDPEDFYILTSKQRIRIPPDFAAEMIAYDPSVGEFRVHYAGFFDPGFGYGNDDIKGTPAVLEVRSHEVPFLLEDDQVVGRFTFERLLSAPEKVYGVEIGSSYQRQGVSLSKQFKSL